MNVVPRFQRSMDSSSMSSWGLRPRLKRYRADGAKKGKTMAVYEVVIDDKRCKGCGMCVEACPKGCLAIGEVFNPAGYFFPAFKPDANCTGCGACNKLCGDFAVTVYEIVEKAS
jgi:2-oxoglutarate ferredoxin oxidoreductase subunit delta